ncbi:hypothetical protein OIV83_002975 [Microbotryomycetes sp. JL201]|nr:hypothetical protein OIV83_002975 [Microbotryomycetes sp. JL201]
MARNLSQPVKKPKMVRVRGSARQTIRSSSHQLRSASSTRTSAKRTMSSGPIKPTYNARVLAAVFKLARHKTKGVSHAAIRKQLEHRAELRPDLFKTKTVNSARVSTSKKQLKDEGLLVSPTKLTLQLDSSIRKRVGTFKEDNDDAETDDEKAAQLVLSNATPTRESLLGEAKSGRDRTESPIPAPVKKVSVSQTSSKGKSGKKRDLSEGRSGQENEQVPLKRQRQASTAQFRASLSKRTTASIRPKAKAQTPSPAGNESEVDELESSDEDSVKAVPIFSKELNKLKKTELVDKVRELTRESAQLRQELSQANAQVERLEHDQEVLANGYELIKENYKELRDRYEPERSVRHGSSSLSELESEHSSEALADSSGTALDDRKFRPEIFTQPQSADKYMQRAAPRSTRTRDPSRERSPPLAPLQYVSASRSQTEMSGYESDNDDNQVSNMLVTPSYTDRMPKIGSFGLQASSGEQSSSNDELQMPEPSQVRPTQYENQHGQAAPPRDGDVVMTPSRQLATPLDTPLQDKKRQFQLGQHTLDLDQSPEPTLVHEYGQALDEEESLPADQDESDVDRDGFARSWQKRDLAELDRKKANVVEDLDLVSQRFQHVQLEHQADLKVLRQEQEALQTEMALARSRLERAHAELSEMATLQEKNEALERQVRTGKGENLQKSLDGIVAEREDAKAAGERELSQAKQRTEELEQALRLRDDELETKRAELEIMEEQYLNQEKRFDETNKKLEAATETRDAMLIQHETALNGERARADKAEQALIDLSQVHHQLREQVQKTAENLGFDAADDANPLDVLELVREHIVSLTRSNSDSDSRLYTSFIISRSILSAFALDSGLTVDVPEESEDSLVDNLGLIETQCDAIRGMLGESRASRDTAICQVESLKEEIKVVRLQLATQHEILSTAISRISQFTVATTPATDVASQQSKEPFMPDVEHRISFARLPEMIDELKSKVVELERHQVDMTAQAAASEALLQSEAQQTKLLQQNLGTVSEQLVEAQKTVRELEGKLQEARPTLARLLGLPLT